MSDTVIKIGRTVLCDWCDTDLTDDTRTGGFLFQSKAVGPCCAEATEATIRGYGEEEFIRGRCTPGMAFADWVRELRGQVPGGDEIRIVGGDAETRGHLAEAFAPRFRATADPDDEDGCHVCGRPDCAGYCGRI